MPAFPAGLEMLRSRAAGAARGRLLLVHGAWHGAWCWDEHVLGYLAEQGYDAYALSLRGHGASTGRDRLRRTRIRDYVDDVARAIQAIGADTVPVGHSMGGFVVQHYLSRHPAPAGVLLASAPPRGVLPLTLRLARRHPAVVARANLSWSLYPVVSTPALAGELLFSPDLAPESVLAYQQRLQDEAYLAFLDMVALSPVRPSRVATPMVVLGGELDRVFTVEEVRATATAYGTSAVIVPGLAHDVMLDPRWQQATDEMLARLNRLSSP